MANDNKSTGQGSAPAKKTLKERIAEKASSRSFNPKFLDGKAVLFNLDNYPVDYTAGGELTGRFVRSTPERESIMRAQGYMKPSEWDSELPDTAFGGLTLMLAESKHSKHRRDMVEQLAKQQEAQKFSPESAQRDWKEGGSKGAIIPQAVETKTETYVGKTPNRSVITPD